MISARLCQIASGHPNAPAILGHRVAISYAELVAAVARVRRLLERRGTQPGDFIAVSLSASPEAVASFFACMDVGAVFMPANPTWSQRELAWLLQQAPPATAILLSGDAPRWLEAGLAQEKLVFVDGNDWPGTEACEGFTAQAWPADHPAACITSSGSVGRPKIAVKTHGGITGTARLVGTACHLGPGHRLLSTVPLYHGSGLANNLILPLLNGATLVVMDRFAPMQAATLLERHAVDYLFTSPVFYSLMIDAQVPAAMLRSLRVCLSAGAPLAASVRAEWKRRYNTAIRQAYGSAEAGLISMQSEESVDTECAGEILPMTEVRILEGEEELPFGEAGEIAVRGPGVVFRYLGDGDGTATRFWKDFVRTGDRGWLDRNGRLYLSGRLRPWINCGGVKVDPLEVQTVVSRMPGIRECLVDAAPGPGGSDVVAAVIAPEPGVEITRADVIQHCRKTLAEFKIPRIIRFVPALATDLTGKHAKSWS